MRTTTIEADYNRASAELAQAEQQASAELEAKRAALADIAEKARIASLEDAERARELRRADLQKQLAAANKAGDHDAHRKRITKAHDEFRRAAAALTAAVNGMRQAYDVQHDAAAKAKACVRELGGVGDAVGHVSAEERIQKMEREIASALGGWLEADDMRRLRVRPTAVRRPFAAGE